MASLDTSRFSSNDTVKLMTQIWLHLVPSFSTRVVAIYGDRSVCHRRLISLICCRFVAT